MESHISKKNRPIFQILWLCPILAVAALIFLIHSKSLSRCTLSLVRKGQKCTPHRKGNLLRHKPELPRVTCMEHGAFAVLFHLSPCDAESDEERRKQQAVHEDGDPRRRRGHDRDGKQLIHWSYRIPQGAQPGALSDLEGWGAGAGGRRRREGVCTHTELFHFVVQQKWIQHRKAKKKKTIHN